MNRPIRTSVLLAAVLAVAAHALAQDLIDVRVDRRFELLSVVFRLAGFQEYRMGSIADYNDAVDAHFGAFKDHPTVVMARSLRASVGYDAIPNLTVRARDAVTFAPLLPLADSKTDLDQRWKPVAAATFLEAMAAFARDTRADRFFEAQDPFYREAVQACRAGLVDHLDRDWFKRTFGTRERDTFTLVIGLLNGGGNYGARVPNGKGGEDLYAIIGTSPAAKGSRPAFSIGYLGTLVHEFLHSFTNPWVDKHLPEVEAAGGALAAPVMQEMRRQAYGSASTVLRESMVRAFTIRYFRELGQEARAVATEAEQDQRAFYWMKDLEALVGEFTGHRARYPTLESFSPRLVAAFQQWGRNATSLHGAWSESRRARLDALFASGPKLAAMVPADGAEDVDPAVSTITFTFDRAMKTGFALIMIDGVVFPEPAGLPTWDADGKTLTLPVRLKPGTAYRFGLNSDSNLGFQDRSGAPVRPMQLGFKTRTAAVNACSSCTSPSRSPSRGLGGRHSGLPCVLKAFSRWPPERNPLSTRQPGQSTWALVVDTSGGQSCRWR
jgi:hypothetical protein